MGSAHLDLLLAPVDGREPDWAALEEAFPWIARLRGCPQDPVHHAEGVLCRA